MLLIDWFEWLFSQGHAVIGRGLSLDGRGHGEDSTEPRGGPLQAGDDKAGKRSHVSICLPGDNAKKHAVQRNVNENICEFQRAREHRGGASR